VQRAYFRFYAELNDFLAPERRMSAFAYPFHVSSSVRDMIESLGVPHTEVDLVLVNGESVGFDYLVRDGDQVSVYPVFESLDITPLLRVRASPLRQPRFVLDVHLGRLAAYLRMLGFDSLYRNDYADAELARISSEEERILLTRDRGLLKRAVITRGHYVRATNPREQLAEVVRWFDLACALAPFTRCLACNGLLAAVAKEAVLERLPARVRQRHDEFLECPSCRRVYWKGTHYDRMANLIRQVGGG
jgi:hypothetical protein